MEHLPKDLWVQIFLTLPVKTILRCLSVCKSWKLFVQDPSFINSHLQHQRRDLMLVRSISVNKEAESDSFRYADNKTKLAEKANPECYSLYCDDESFTLYAKHELPLHYWRGHYRIVGSCNGIICITDDDFGTCHDTYLWNPTIRKIIKFPRPIFTFDKIGGFEHELGFGFDEKTNDYKVVRIVDRVDWYKAPLEVEIYSLSSGVWRKASHLASDLNVGIFHRAGSVKNCQVYLNGALHWVGKDREQSRCMVIAFHLGDEVFRCFEPPLDVMHDRWKKNLRPVVFQGSLSLIHCRELSRFHRRDSKCSIWMMKDYGDSTSWAKYVDVNLSHDVDRVIGLQENGDLLIEIKEGLFSYKPTEGKTLNYLDGIYLWQWQLLQEGHIEGFGQWVYDYDPKHAPKELGIRSKTKGSFENSFHSESYVESLVLLGRINSAEESKLKRKKKKKKKKVAKLRAKESEMINEGDNKQPRFEAAEEHPLLLKSVYVRNLPFDVTAAGLEQEFKTFGKIIPDGVFIKNKKEIGVCYAFVEYESLQAVYDAVIASPLQLFGRQIYVEERKANSSSGAPRVDRSGRGRGRGSYQSGRGGNQGNGSRG